MIWIDTSPKHMAVMKRCLVSLVTAAAAATKSLQSCPTLCMPIDGSPPSSPAPGILQARTLEWVAISFFNVWKWKVKVKLLSCVQLFATPWNAAYQAPLSMGFSRQEYWSGLSLPSLRSLREMQIKTTVRYHLILVRMAIIKKFKTINAGEGVEKRQPSYIAGGNVNWYSHYGRWYGDSLKN